LFIPIEVTRHASRFSLDFGAETAQEPLRFYLSISRLTYYTV